MSLEEGAQLITSIGNFIIVATNLNQTKTRTDAELRRQFRS